MSEFECRNGHLMSGSKCSICGGGIHTMDGMTRSECNRREKAERYYNPRIKENPEEEPETNEGIQEASKEEDNE